ncbi:hypothetical protein GCM10023334_026090 [Nonomuraea thailandensis]
MAREQVERLGLWQLLVQGAQQGRAQALTLPVGGDDEAAHQAGGAGHLAAYGADDPRAVERLEHERALDDLAHLLQRLDEGRDVRVAVELGLAEVRRALQSEELARVRGLRSFDHHLRQPISRRSAPPGSVYGPGAGCR